MANPTHQETHFLVSHHGQRMKEIRCAASVCVASRQHREDTLPSSLGIGVRSRGFEEIPRSWLQTLPEWMWFSRKVAQLQAFLPKLRSNGSAAYH